VSFLLLLAVPLVVLYLFQKVIDTAYNKRSKHKFNDVFEHKTDCPVMIFGSSVANVHLDPRVFRDSLNMECFNEGLHGLFFAQYNCLINEYLSYQKKCRCIVVGCDIDNLGNNASITRPDLFLSHLSEDNVYNSLSFLQPKEMTLAHYLPGYKLTLLSKQFYRSIFFPPSVSNINGYEPVSLTEKWQATVDTPFSGLLDPVVFNKLKTISAAITNKNIELIFLMMPIYNKGYALIKNADAIKACYRELEQSNPHIHFIDYTKDTMCNNQTYFYNYSHMRENGAKVISEKTAHLVKQILESKQKGS